MRLKRLDLTRYGKFTDQCIEFGERQANVPDLHIVYGPNEAGKSTALAAFLDLLFGIEPRSRFNFLHPYPAMRIGAAIELASGIHEFVRVKRDGSSLLDGDERPIADGVIQGALGGIDRGAYSAMFSLDEETLEEGGESILESKGDLGRLLFSASAGLAELSRELEALKEKADEFYKFHARKYKLALLRDKLGALETEREKIDTAAPRYAALREARTHAKERYEEALCARGKTGARIEEIKRLLGAMPRLAELRRVREKLGPLADLRAAPADWHEWFPKLRDDDLKLATKAEQLDREVSRRSDELGGIVLDETSLGLADRIIATADLAARYRTAEKDIPERRIEVAEEDRIIGRILERLGRKDEAAPERLPLDAVTTGALRELIESHSGVETAHRTAASELNEAHERCDRARGKLDEAGGGTPLSEAVRDGLTRAKEALDAGNFPPRLRKVARERDRCSDELGTCVEALRPWRGEIAELVEASVPEPDEIAELKNGLAAARLEHERSEKEGRRLEEERSIGAAEFEAITTGAGVVSDEEAARTRAEREAAWAEHRRRLDADSADIFESALRRDDIVTNARLLREADVQKLRRVREGLARVEVMGREAAAALARASAALARKEGDVAAVTAPFLPAGAKLPAFESWLVKRGKAVEAHASLEDAERALAEAEEDAKGARENLRRALALADAAVPPEASADALQAATRNVLGREVTLSALGADVRKCEDAMVAREQNLAGAQAAEAEWNAAWRRTCGACWLGEGGTPPALAVVKEILPALTELGPALDRRAGLLDRIQKMERDQQAFADEVAQIAGELGMTAPDAPPPETARAIHHRLAEARERQKDRSDKARDLAAIEEQREALTKERRLHESLKTQMTAFFAVTTLDEVGEKLAAIKEKGRLEEAAAAAGREIAERLSLPLGEAEARVQEADQAALKTELDELCSRFEGEDQRIRELFAELCRAEDALERVGGDDAAARIGEQRKTTLLEIEDGARRYLRLRIGVAAAEHALRVYRQRHRSTMMAEASEAFRIICRGAYARLESQPTKDGEELIAISADGGSKVAAQLSRGSRFQLYLALRVAAYTEFTRGGRAPVPFIADDIMESFDDFRAEEALRLLAKMAKVGQVIHLTHHRHLSEIARRVCPGVTVHELAGTPAPAQ